MEQKLSALKGLGPKSEKHLNEVGIYTKSDLKEIGPVKAFIKLKRECSVKPSLNFLYAMIGAINDVHWTRIAHREKGRLLMELEDYREFEKIIEIEEH